MPCYDQSCTASDLVSIPSLVLSDTFNTWFDRTNQLIQVSNAINLFDVGVGPTDGGLLLERGCTNGFYSGVGVLYVNPGAGIGIGTEAFTNNYNKVVVDVARLADLGGSTGINPQEGDYFIVSDVSDARQGTYGTPKRVLARRMLPDEIEFGSNGDGTLTIQGNLSVIGNIDVQGTQSFIDSNDLRIEDKLIELAYGRYAEMTVLGTGLTSGSFSAGMTALYDDDVVPNIPANATTIGRVYSWTIGTPGVSGTIRISSFAEGGVNDFIPGGNLVVTGAPYTQNMQVANPIGAGDYFLTDSQLEPAGLAIKGSEGDKTFLWVCGAPNSGGKNWNAFVANTNLGVSGPGNWIVASKYASYGYTDDTVNNTFTYLGQTNAYSKYTVGQQLVMEHNALGSLTGGHTFGIVHMGSTGPNILPGVPVYDWVKYFNADQLDGAHATTANTPWSIPILNGDGRLNGDFLNADAIRKTFTVSGHAFQRGDVVRVDSNGSLTFAAANTVPTAEALGIVANVSGNDVLVTTKGFVSGLSGSRINVNRPLMTGNVYYLSPVTPGGMIDSPDSGIGIDVGEVRKAMLLAMGSDSGYVLNYTGVVIGDDITDHVFVSSFTPVGGVQPFAGPIGKIPRHWLLCDGSRLDRYLYSDLYDAIGNSFYAEASKVEGSSSILLVGDTRKLAVNDLIRLTWDDAQAGTISVNAKVDSVNTTTREVVVTASDESLDFSLLDGGTSIRVYGRVGTDGTSVFFIPDLRRRTAYGSSSGANVPGSGNLVPALELGSVGGSNQVLLNTQAAFGNEVYAHTTSGVTHMPPYTTVNWIIRVKKGAEATILTGHNHDLYYIRHNIPHTVAGGAANDLGITERNQFRDNARVLGDGRDGPDTFESNLGVIGNVGVTGNIRVSASLTASNLFGGNVVSLGSLGVSGSGASVVGFNPPLHYGITGATARNAYPQTVQEVATVNVRDPRYDEFYYTGVGGGTASEWARTANTAKAVPLTIQTDSGMVTCTPMHRVINREATNYEKSRLPQGFIWVNTTNGRSYIKSGEELHRLSVIGSGVPVGSIILWSGTIATIPSGWALCNGQSYNVNGTPIATPDLRDKFIIAASVDSGGVARTRIEGVTNPRQMGGYKDTVLVAHRHNFVTDDNGGTQHADFGIVRLDGQYSGGASGGGALMRYYTSMARRVDTQGNILPGEPLAGDTQEQGINKNLPPYYALAYIMKVVQDGVDVEPNPPPAFPCDPCASNQVERVLVVLDSPTGTWTVPNNVTSIMVEVVAGGGGGISTRLSSGGSSQPLGAAASGGQGGRLTAKYTVTPGQTYQYTVGGGAPADGSSGRSSTFLGITALGGSSASGLANSADPGTAGSASIGNVPLGVTVVSNFKKFVRIIDGSGDGGVYRDTTPYAWSLNGNDLYTPGQGGGPRFATTNHSAGQYRTAGVGGAIIIEYYRRP